MISTCYAKGGRQHAGYRTREIAESLPSRVLYRILKLGGCEKYLEGSDFKPGGVQGGLCIETPPGGLKVGGSDQKVGGVKPPQGGLYESLLPRLWRK